MEESSPWKRQFVIGIAALIIIGAAAWAYTAFSGNKVRNDPFLSLALINSYTQDNYGYSFKQGTFDGTPITLVCNSSAPKGPAETDAGQFTYCQNNGRPVKVSLSWKESGVALIDYLTRIANTAIKNTREKSGDFVCLQDKSSVAVNSFPGVLSDCKITTSSGSSYYFSAFFFSPSTHPEISQVLYVYDSDNPSDEGAVKAMVRGLAETVVF